MWLIYWDDGKIREPDRPKFWNIWPRKYKHKSSAKRMGKKLFGKENFCITWYIEKIGEG